MGECTRRKFLQASAAGLFGHTGDLLSAPSSPIANDHVNVTEPKTSLPYDKWMDEAIKQEGKSPTKSIEGTLQLSRFVEPIYYLTASTKWKPDGLNERKYASVVVPRGFVTDLASIPREFFSLLRPDGEYCHAAIIHDYLYWNQTTSRQDADAILKMAMLDTSVSTLTLNIIFKAVDLLGQSSWDKNQSLRQAGEKRILKDFPTSAVTRWEDWKRMPSVFA